MSRYSGRWIAVSTATTNTKIPFVEPIVEAEIAALTISAQHLSADCTAVEGLAIEIADDYSFLQQVKGTPRVEWFDVEGVLDNSVTPFDGSGFVAQDRERLYLIADDRPAWATPKAEAKLNLFRCDTGDTLICDFVELAAAKLARTINVLTDGKRLSQTLLMFARDPNAA